MHAYGVIVCVLLAALLVVGLVSLHAERAKGAAICASLQRIEINQGVLIREVNSLEAARPAAAAPKPKVVKPKAPPKPCREKAFTVMGQTVVCCCVPQ